MSMGERRSHWSREDGRSFYMVTDRLLGIKGKHLESMMGHNNEEELFTLSSIPRQLNAGVSDTHISVDLHELMNSFYQFVLSFSHVQPQSPDQSCHITWENNFFMLNTRSAFQRTQRTEIVDGFNVPDFREQSLWWYSRLTN